MRRRKNLLSRIIFVRSQQVLAYAHITGTPFTSIINTLYGMPDAHDDVILRVRPPYE